jgi:hypothetical protein
MRNIAIGFGLAAAIFAAIGVAYAAIPHSQTGVVTACVGYITGGTRIIDEEAGQQCRAWERKVELASGTALAAPTYYTVHATGIRFASAECEDGDIATGGGAGYVLGGLLSLSQPILSGNAGSPAIGWFGQLEQSDDRDVNVYAICLDLTP